MSPSPGRPRSLGLQSTPRPYILLSHRKKPTAGSVTALVHLSVSSMQRLRAAAFLRVLSSTAGSACTVAVPRAGLGVPAYGGVARRLAAAGSSQRSLSTAAEQSLSAGGIGGAYRRVQSAPSTSLAAHARIRRAWSNGGGLVHCYAAVDPSAIIEPGAVVFPGARIAAGCRVGACSVVGPGVVLGEGTQVGYSCSLSHATVGVRCTLHHGVRLGADGFGFAVGPTGELTKKPQERSVVLGDGVELGANTCVDRGSWRDTRIGDNTKVDNLVQIGHNVVIGALRATRCFEACS